MSYVQVLYPPKRQGIGVRPRTRQWILIGLPYAATLAVIVAAQITADQLAPDPSLAPVLPESSSSASAE